VLTAMWVPSSASATWERRHQWVGQCAGRPTSPSLSWQTDTHCISVQHAAATNPAWVRLHAATPASCMVISQSTMTTQWLTTDRRRHLDHADVGLGRPVLLSDCCPTYHYTTIAASNTHTHTRMHAPTTALYTDRHDSNDSEHATKMTGRHE